MPFLSSESAEATAVDSNPPKGQVLLTGGSGFIASHILDYLLADGFEVVATARSKQKGHQIIEGVETKYAKNVQYAVVEDVAQPGAFDAVLQSTPFDFVIHTASPYHLNVVDPVKDFLDPAIKGTTGLLHSTKAHCPTTRRVVLTSSSAAMLNPGRHAAVYDETCWAPASWEMAMDPMHTYRCSKVFSERAAWAFIEEEKPTFDLAVINSTYNFGPVQRALPSLEAMNTSNHRVRDMVLGRMRDRLEPTAPVFTWVDVRDVALAHVRAMSLPEAGGHRFYLVSSHFSNKRVAEIIRDRFPQLRDRLPPADSVDDLPNDVYKFNNTKSKQVLKIEYKELEESVHDTVCSILEQTPQDL
ncbi:methylglyoxal reductase (NADPH-dependent) gre2 [Pestalotiopsis sp. 9143b]|nr:methylglyoxal reductase (NADPH-dependent) gre2 [Pestalotiopsis sp. 9143b]